jgi:hypothetical protein
MTVYFQHIGEALWQRDGKRSIGTPTDGVLTFHLTDIEPYLQALPAGEVACAKLAISKFSSSGFQVWGLPSGATRAINKMTTGDILLLLESVSFRYIGNLVFKFTLPLWDLSRHIWGEQRFPLIVLTKGIMCQYPWDDFIKHFSYDPNYSWQKLRGLTNSVSEKKIANSRFKSDASFYEHISNNYFEPKDKN